MIQEPQVPNSISEDQPTDGRDSSAIVRSLTDVQRREQDKIVELDAGEKHNGRNKHQPMDEIGEQRMIDRRPTSVILTKHYLRIDAAS